MALPSNVHTVPVLWQGRWDLTMTADPVVHCVEWLYGNGSTAAPGFKNPEGIVVWHRASGQLFKWTTGGGRADRAEDPSPVENP